MTYPTHKQYAISFAFVVAMLIYKFNWINIYYISYLPILILTSKYGGLFPDIDHTWKNVKDKTVPNWIINKVIHITGGRHRSWQTHSIDIALIFTMISLAVPKLLVKYNIIDSLNSEIIEVILIGFCSGWLSHLFADMMTSAGVRLFFWNRKIIIKFVPNHIGKLHFNTGHEWEEFVFKCTKTINIILGIICIAYPFVDTYISQSTLI